MISAGAAPVSGEAWRFLERRRWGQRAHHRLGRSGGEHRHNEATFHL